jgi:hypothetical protein
MGKGRNMKKLLYVIALGLGLQSIAAVKLIDGDKMRSFYEVNRFPTDRISQVKIAVIDNGFLGYQAGSGQLPSSAVLVEKYDPEFIKKYNLGNPAYHENMGQTEHGLQMAEIAWAWSGGKEEGPKFYLLNGNGITNFRIAVRYAIENRVDIVLYSQNRECCGNFDGGGFINQIVNEATAQGILWVNAAGNYGGRVFNSNVVMDEEGLLYFGNRSRLRIKSHVDDNPAQIILSYTGGWDSETQGTEKDIDMFLYDPDGNQVAKADLKQVLQKDKLESGETFLARERINYTFARKDGDYTLELRAKSGAFTGNDHVRIVVIPQRDPIKMQDQAKPVDPVQLLDATPGYELMVPADNPTVLTIGDINAYSASGPNMRGDEKPDFLMERSEASFSNGSISSGTSNAAALFAGIVAILKAYNPSLSKYDLLRFVKDKARVPSAPAEEKLKVVPMSDLPQSFSGLLKELRQQLSGAPTMAGQYPSGRFALGLPVSPLDTFKLLCGEIPAGHQAFQQAKGDAEYFITFNRGVKDPVCYGRGEALCCIKNPSGVVPYFPWDYSGRDEREYLHLKKIRHVNGALGDAAYTEVPANKVWRTPNPREIAS